MVTITGHGGNCCGARHIYGFGTGDNPVNITEMHNHVASTPDRLTEIILNRNQCRNSPNLLTAMAARGFVLTTGFKNGNHDSDVFVFHRADRRLRLDNTERDFGFEWTGQIAEPTLHGNLNPLQVNGVAVANTNGLQEQYRRQGAGFYLQFFPHYPGDMTLQYVGPAGHLRGRIFALPVGYPNWQSARIYLPSGGAGVRVRDSVTGDVRELSTNSFLIQRFTQAAEQLAAPLQLGNQRYATAAVAQPAVEVEEERIVYTTFHNVYRDGRIGAGYPTSQEAQNAAPRALNRLTRHIYNTGRVVDTQNQGE